MDVLEAVQKVNKLYERLDARREAVLERQEYYLGKQPLRFATEEWAAANAKRYEGFADNWCRPVADAENERIRHTGIKLAKEHEQGQELLNGWWDANELDAQSSQGFLASIITARSYALVWGDRDDEPIVTWERADQCEIEYSWENRRQRTAALKTWADEKTEYATLYTDTEVWKFHRDRVQPVNPRESQSEQGTIHRAHPGGWRPRELKSEMWPLRHPFGRVPMVEIPNRPLLGHDPLSEIAGVMGMQNAANLLWAYLFLAADYASMDARVIFGTAPKIPILDDNGQKIGERDVKIEDIGGKRLILITDPNGKIDAFEAADLGGFTKVIEVIVGHIAAQTRTPPTYLVTTTGMSNVNAEGLKASEIGLVKKSLEFHLFVSPELRELYSLMAIAANDIALSKLARRGKIGWANPEIRSEAQLADALIKKKQSGYPVEYLLELDGVEEGDMKRILAMIAAEQADAQLDHALRELNEYGSAPGFGEVLSGAAADS